MIIIDPSRDGCHVWYKDNVQFLRGNISEVCSRIKKFVMYKDMAEHEIQGIDILLDTMGVGIPYADWFEHNNISYTKVKPKQFIK